MPTLFEEVKIGNLELKNRIVMDPMGFSHTDSDGGYSDRQIEYYVERARGGFGLIYPTATMVTTRFEYAPMPNVLKHTLKPHVFLFYVKRCIITGLRYVLSFRLVWAGYPL